MVCRGDNDDSLDLDLDDDAFLRLRNIQDAWTPAQEMLARSSYSRKKAFKRARYQIPEVKAPHNNHPDHAKTYDGACEQRAGQEWWGQEPEPFE